MASAFWDFEHGLIDLIPADLAGTFEYGLSSYVPGYTIPYVDAWLRLDYAVEPSKTRFTGTIGTFEYGLIDFIPRTYGMSEKSLTLAYMITGPQGALIEASDTLLLRYDVWSQVETGLEVVYNLLGEEVGARSLVLAYDVRNYVEKNTLFAYNVVTSFATFTLTRGAEGFMWEDPFDGTVDPRWEFSPSTDRADLSSGASVVLRHGYPPIYMLANVQLPHWALEAEISYRPTLAKDEGGLVVWGKGEDRFGLFLAEVKPDELPPRHIRLIGHPSRIEGWSSIDGKTWVYRGTQVLSGISQAGFALFGETGDDLEIHHARWFRGDSVMIYGMYPGMRAAVHTSEGRLVSQSFCRYRGHIVEASVASQPWPFDGTITLYDPQGRLVSQTLTGPIQGGDEWYFFLPLQVRFNGQAIDPGTIVDAGVAGHAHRFEIINNNTEPSPILKVSVRLPNGEEAAAYLARDDNGRPGVDRLKTIEVPSIPAGGYAVLWLINERPDFVLHEDSYIYEVVLEV